jgi:hypothetical protein
MTLHREKADAEVIEHERRREAGAAAAHDKNIHVHGP